MSVGTTVEFALTRNELIASALRKVKGWPEDGNPPVHKLREAIRALNNIMRLEDLKQTGLSKSLWALASTWLPLTAGRYIYGESESLPLISELHTVTARDVNGGDGACLDIIGAAEYAALSPKNEVGEPLKVYLKKARLPADQTLWIWPAPSSVTAADTVIQSEVEYTCILAHTSASENKPGSGASWTLFWKAGAVSTGSADTWVTATDYTTGEAIVLNYKRPLYDFDSQYDNPDMPLGWEDYLIYKLAIRLAPEYDIGMEQRQALKADLAQIELDVFPSTREAVNTLHNHSRFF